MRLTDTYSDRKGWYGRRKINDITAVWIRSLYLSGEATRKELAARFGVSIPYIGAILHGDTHRGTALDPQLTKEPLIPEWIHFEPAPKTDWQIRDEELRLARRKYVDFKYMVEGSRQCFVCHEFKPIEEFAVIDSRGYRRKICSSCPWSVSTAKPSTKGKL